MCGHSPTIVEVQTNVLHCVRALGIEHSDPRVNCLNHMTVAEFVIPFWENVLPAGEMLRRLDYLNV